MIILQNRSTAFVFCVLTLLAVAHSVGRAAPSDEGPSADWSRLADVKIQNKLQLSAEQQQQIDALLKQRSESLAAAADEARPGIDAEFAQKLSAVLNDQQRAAFQEQVRQPKLRFNFRFQKWTEVLEWFAEQADLSLVLDAPPPGTFNYSDNREYTPSEAIDLLNGVLQAKDFTLIRRDRMLILVNLKEGIPEGLIPRIRLDELDERGRFELVSVLFPLGRRVAADVNNEVTPLLSQHGKCVPLPQTKQLLVTDMAGIMRAVGAIIESIPEPPEKKPESPKQPEKPVLTVYPVKAAAPSAAVEALQALMPEAKFVHDAKASQISAFATPTQQAAVKTVLDQMEANNPPDRRPRLELYPVDPDNAVALLENLRLMLPGAQLRLNSEADRLVLWGTPEEHETLTQGLQRLQSEGPALASRQVAVYPLHKVEPTAAMSLLQTLVPRARLSLDNQTQRLIAVAVSADQKIIRDTLDQLQPDESGPDASQLRIYPLERPPADGLIAVLNSLVPRAQVTPDEAHKRLIVVAAPADHEVVQSTIDRMAESQPEMPASTLEIYPVTPAQKRRLEAVIGSLKSDVPDAQIIADAQPGELAVWAPQRQHAVIQKLLDELKGQPPVADRFRLVSYPITVADPSSAQTVLQNLFPDAKVVVDAKSRRLLVWTGQSEHAAIEQAVEQINAGQPAQPAEAFRVYPMTGADPAAAVAMLQQLWPDIRFSTDRIAGTIMAWGPPAELEKVSATVEQMQVRQSPEHKPRVVTYEMDAANAAAIIPVLRRLAPAAQIDMHPESQSIVAWATPEEHEAIRAAIDQVARRSGPRERSTLEVYPLKNTNTSSALNILQDLFRNDASRVELSLDPYGQQLVALAEPEQHAIIRATIERLHTEEPEFEVFPLEVLDPSAAMLAIDRLFADTGVARGAVRPAVEADPVAQQLYVRGNKDAIRKVRELLVKMGETGLGSAEPAGGERRRIRVIPFRGDTNAAVEQLQRVWPQLRRNAIRVVTPSAIAPTLNRSGDSRRVDPESSPEGRPEPDDGVEQDDRHTPSHRQPDAGDASPAGDAHFSVQDAVPTDSGSARSSEADANAIGSPPSSDEPGPPGIGEAPPAESTSQPPVEPNDDSSPPVVIAPGDGRITIASDDLDALDRMEVLLRAMSQRPATRGHDFVVFSLRNSSADRVAGTLQQLFQSPAFRSRSPAGVTVVPDTRLNALLVHANRNDRATIEDLLTILDTGEIPESLAANKPRVIPLQFAQAARVVDVVRDIYRTQMTSGGGRQPIPVPSGVEPEVAAAIQQYNAAVSGPLLSIAVDMQTNALIVLAPGTLAREIEQLVGELDRTAGESSSRGFKLIPLKSANSQHVQDVLDEMFDLNSSRRRRR